jgi:adenylosuccinate lyase
MLSVEIAVAQVQAELGIIPRAAASAIAKRGDFDLARITEIEKTTRHDVIAFVSSVAEKVGSHGRFVHYGLTSSDVLDTALSLLVRDAIELLDRGVAGLEEALMELIGRSADALCAGRTHGMHAEPTTFGYKMAGHCEELRRNRLRIHQACQQVTICKLSGAVGTYSALGPEVEEKVAKRLKLTAEPVATQVVPRDRHAQVFFALASLAAGYERLAVELRHLQRTEVGEVTEGFAKGQKGSSAMPHKKNPISAENITGCSRMMRSFLSAAMENIALWHERDISHSSVERVFLSDAFILIDYMTARMTELLRGLQVHPEKMRENVQRSGGHVFSSHVLLALVKAGRLSREEAYTHVQRVSHGLGTGESLHEALLRDREIQLILKDQDLSSIFSGETHLKMIRQRLVRLGYQKKAGRRPK